MHLGIVCKNDREGLPAPMQNTNHAMLQIVMLNLLQLHRGNEVVGRSAINHSRERCFAHLRW